MNKVRYIYITTNLLNGVQYVGQRKLPANTEIEKDSYLGSGTILLSAIKKHGRKNFKKEILEVCYSQSEADRLEQFYFDKFGVLRNRDKFYNRALAGQKWREIGHSEFMSNTMKEYYSIPENLDNMYLKRYGITKSEFERIKNENEVKKYNNKIDRLNKKIKKAKYKFYRNQTQDLRKEFYTESNRIKQKEIWKTKKSDPEFIKAIKKGNEKKDYKKISDGNRIKISSSNVKNKSIIYDKLHEFNLSGNELKCNRMIQHFLYGRFKSINGLLKGINTLTNRLKNECGIIIDKDDLINESKIIYKEMWDNKKFKMNVTINTKLNMSRSMMKNKNIIYEKLADNEKIISHLDVKIQNKISTYIYNKYKNKEPLYKFFNDLIEYFKNELNINISISELEKDAQKNYSLLVN